MSNTKENLATLFAALSMLWCLNALHSEEGLPTPSKEAKDGIVEMTPTLRMDMKNKQVVLDAEIVLTQGPLELLLCPKRTKEHEAILAADIAPRSFQLALLGVGAEPGAPALFEPEYKPPRGQPIEIFVEWEEMGQKKRANARDWIRHPKDAGGAEPLKAEFVFAGSRFIRIPGEERARWLGDDGDVVCVSNFPGSIIDVDIKSTNANEGLLFEAWTERIPPKGTKVKVFFVPTKEMEKKTEKEPKAS
ncbi:YdjY domain-containing protein [bacterium]|nr:YdjY domain-containing protein [bacterium]